MHKRIDLSILKKARGHIGRNVVEMTINIKAIVRKCLMIKIFLSHTNSFQTDLFELYMKPRYVLSNDEM